MAGAVMRVGDPFEDRDDKDQHDIPCNNMVLARARIRLCAREICRWSLHWCRRIHPGGAPLADLRVAFGFRAPLGETFFLEPVRFNTSWGQQADRFLSLARIGKLRRGGLKG
jgi:hypothetical protein